MKRRCGAARFNQTNPAFGPVQGGGPTIWMGGTGPTIFNDKLYVVTGERSARLQTHAPAMFLFGIALCHKHPWSKPMKWVLLLALPV